MGDRPMGSALWITWVYGLEDGGIYVCGDGIEMEYSGGMNCIPRNSPGAGLFNIHFGGGPDSCQEKAGEPNREIVSSNMQSQQRPRECLGSQGQARRSLGLGRVGHTHVTTDVDAFACVCSTLHLDVFSRINLPCG